MLTLRREMDPCPQCNRIWRLSTLSEMARDRIRRETQPIRAAWEAKNPLTLRRQQVLTDITLGRIIIQRKGKALERAKDRVAKNLRAVNRWLTASWREYLRDSHLLPITTARHLRYGRMETALRGQHPRCLLCGILFGPTHDTIPESRDHTGVCATCSRDIGSGHSKVPKRMAGVR